MSRPPALAMSTTARSPELAVLIALSVFGFAGLAASQCLCRDDCTNCIGCAASSTTHLSTCDRCYASSANQ